MQHLWLQRCSCPAWACCHSFGGQSTAAGGQSVWWKPQCARQEHLFICSLRIWHWWMLVSPPWGACHPVCTVSAWWVLPGVLWQMERSCLVPVIHKALLCSRCIWKVSQIIHLPLWHWSSSASWRPEGTENRFSLGCSLGQGLSVSMLGKQLESYSSPEQFLQQLQESWVPTNCKCDWGTAKSKKFQCWNWNCWCPISVCAQVQVGWALEWPGPCPWQG